MTSIRLDAPTAHESNRVRVVTLSAWIAHSVLVCATFGYVTLVWNDPNVDKAPVYWLPILIIDLPAGASTFAVVLLADDYLSTSWRITYYPPSPLVYLADCSGPCGREGGPSAARDPKPTRAPTADTI
jgi:hypothetical protein